MTMVLAACGGGSSSSATWSNPAPIDTTPPSRPNGLTAVATGMTGASLAWGAATDNTGVTDYVVHRNGTQIATPTTTAFTDAGLSAGTTYAYTVAARDAAGNVSSAASASVTTAPSPPSNSVSLAWDPVVAPSLSGYRVYFGNAPGTYLQPFGQGVSVGNVTTHTVLGLNGAARYYFVVTATDTLNNESVYSNEVFKDLP